MPFCPSCRQEFESFASQCPDCEVELTETLAEPKAAPAGPEVAVVAAVDAATAEAMLERLAAVGIPSTPAEEEETPFGVAVPVQFLNSAVAMLEADDRLALQEDDGTGRPVFRPFDPAIDASPTADLRLDILDESPARLAARGEEVIADLLEIVRRGEGEPVKRATLVVMRMDAGRAVLCRHLALLCRERREDAVYAVLREVREKVSDAAELRELCELAADRDLPVEPRTLALHALGRFEIPGLASAVLPILDDDDEGLREAADEALCSIADEDMDFDASADAGERAESVARWRRHFGLA